MEAFQPSGSFKARGMGAACLAAKEAGATRVVCASGGNAGYAVAYAGQHLQLDVTIIVPQTTPARSRELIQSTGAQLLVHGAAWDDAYAYAVTLAQQTGAVNIHPFDDPQVWRGHASLVREIAAAGIKPGAIVLSVGGGGLLCGVVLALALGLHVAAGAGAFAAGTVYADPRLPPMMAVFALTALLQGAESMQLATAQRELRGGHLARLEIGSQLVAMAVTLALAVATRSVWALLVGMLVASAARTAGSHFCLPGRTARPCWDRSCAREIVGFGKWIFLSSSVGFLAANGEKILLGGTLAAGSFGVFAIAATLLAAVTNVYATLNGHVIFSSLSDALRTGDAQTVRVYTRVQQLADLFLGGAAGFLLAAGQWAVWILYDPRYHAACWMLQLLGLGLLAMRHQVVEQLMFARGEPGWVSANNALRAIGLLVFIPAGFAAAGERGAIAGVVLAQFASWPLSLWFKHRQGLLCRATEQWWLPALLAGAALGWLLDRLLGLWLPH
jgi:O-antigen/teichoic acid export membrane protein